MTWSILARDASGAFGIAIASRFFAVGALCPHVRSGVGALATQALVNPAYARPGLDLLAEGLAASGQVASSRTGPWCVCEATSRTVSTPASVLARARMAADERHGVVDAECRSFAVPNLYITDGSVLPTQGSANPALTIMAIAARAADRLIAGARSGRG